MKILISPTVLSISTSSVCLVSILPYLFTHFLYFGYHPLFYLFGYFLNPCIMDFSGLFCSLQFQASHALSCQLLLTVDRLLMCSVDGKPSSVITVFLWNSIHYQVSETIYRTVFQMFLSQKLPQSRPNLTSLSQLQDSHTTWKLWVHTTVMAGPIRLEVSVVYEGFCLSWSPWKRAPYCFPGLRAGSFYSPSCGDSFSGVLKSSRVSIPAHLLSCTQGHAFCHLVDI